MKRAVSEAVAECIAGDILADFFREHREEIVEMGIYEFDQEVYDQVIREEAYEDGMVEGEKNGDLKRLVSLVCKKMKKNKTLEEIAEDLEEESTVIEPFYRAAEKFAPEYDTESVFEYIIQKRNLKETEKSKAE